MKVADIVRCLEEDGWRWADPGRHKTMVHPRKKTKVSVSHGAHEYSPKSTVFKSILRQAGMTTREFEAIYWKLDP